MKVISYIYGIFGVIGSIIVGKFLAQTGFNFTAFFSGLISTFLVSSIFYSIGVIKETQNIILQNTRTILKNQGIIDDKLDSLQERQYVN